jgi:predicted HicB family RNase H-like nuclease
MKTFPILVDDDLHKRIKHAAIDEGLTLHQWVIDALMKKIRDKENQKLQPKNLSKEQKND